MSNEKTIYNLNITIVPVHLIQLYQLMKLFRPRVQMVFTINNYMCLKFLPRLIIILLS